MVEFLNALPPKAQEHFGGKAYNLAQLSALGIPIPQGFAISTKHFNTFLNSFNQPKLLHEFYQASISHLENCLAIAAKLHTIASSLPVPLDTAHKIKEGCLELRRRIGDAPLGFAIRSSATVEDRVDLSFAGQAESYLCISSDDQILDGVKRTWISAFSPRAIMYLYRKRVPLKQLQMGVIVQEMVPADISGTMFTVNVVTNNTGQLLVDATWGLGEALVQGKVTPDSFLLSKDPLEVLDRKLGSKEVYSTPHPAKFPTCTILKGTPPEKRQMYTLSDEALYQIAKMGMYIEEQMGYAQDIEWSIKGKQLIILQTRPITTLQKLL